MRHPHLLHEDLTGLIVIDLQEKFIPVIHEGERVIESTCKLIRAFNLLSRPVVVTEQYPEGLGKTVESVVTLISDFNPLEKRDFSCCAIAGFIQMLREKHIHQTVLCGIETHVCLWQTAMDLLHAGFKVVVAAEAVSSRHEENRYNALQRLQANGIPAASIEMILFELLYSAQHPCFKEIQALIK